MLLPAALFLFARPLCAQTADETFTGWLGGLRDGSYVDKEQIVEQMTTSGHPSTRAVLAAFIEDRLFARNSDQRVFLGWAQVWRSKQREDAVRQQVASDVHSPGRYRVIGPTRNVDAWYDAFGVKPGDKYYLKPDERVRIW